MIAKIFGEESGQGIVEYAFILILVALACVVGFRAIGYSAGNRVNYVNSQVP
jgi:Flp pilus assembly pilin Flp